MMKKHPAIDLAGSKPGSALDVYTIDALRQKIQLRSNTSKAGLADQLSDNSDLDQLDKPKYPDSAMRTYYICGGTFSINGATGELVFTDLSPRPSSGAVYVNKKKGKFTSTANTTTVGSPEIKTLTGLQINPFGVRRPSTSITPFRDWTASLFPTLSRSSLSDWALVIFSQEVFFQLLTKLGKPERVDTTVREDRKDLGTLIVDNQDFEQRILQGDI